MRLTLYTDYALRTLIYLGRRPNELGTIGGIADYHGISRNHLVKVVHQLGAKGYIDTLRGKGGGIRLAYAPEKINIGRVVRDMEENMEIAECFRPKNKSCISEGDCLLKGTFREALDSFLSTLDQYTLSDMLGPRPAAVAPIRVYRQSAAAYKRAHI